MLYGDKNVIKKNSSHLFSGLGKLNLLNYFSDVALKLTVPEQ